jgi:hypothetical protein
LNMAVSPFRREAAKGGLHLCQCLQPVRDGTGILRDLEDRRSRLKRGLG